MILVEFGDSNKLALQLSGTLDIRSSIAPPVVPLQDLDGEGKRVVIIQCGVKSLRNVTADEFEHLVTHVFLHGARSCCLHCLDA